MTFKPGQSGNPRARLPGSRNRKKTALVLRILKGRGDTDPLDLLSAIVTCAEAPLELRVQAVGMRAPYQHSRCTARYIGKKIDLPVVETVEQATACIAQIGALAAAGKLALDEANDLVGYQKAFIEAKIGTELEQRIAVIELALQRANINLGVAVEGGMPVMRGCENVKVPARLLSARPQPSEESMDRENGCDGR
jgi:hypothetical protein